MTEISEWYTNEGLGRSLSLLLFIRNVAHSKHWGCFWAPGTLDSILYQTPSSFGPVRERHASKCQWWHGFKNPVCSCLHDWQRLMTLLSASETIQSSCLQHRCTCERQSKQGCAVLLRFVERVCVLCGWFKTHPVIAVTWISLLWCRYSRPTWRLLLTAQQNYCSYLNVILINIWHVVTLVLFWVGLFLIKYYN